MAILIRTDGTLRIMRDIHRLSYDDLRDILGGPTEYVYFEDGRALIVNEEFKFQQLPRNVGATSLVQQHQEPAREGISPALAAEAVGSPDVQGPAILVEASELTQMSAG